MDREALAGELRKVLGKDRVSAGVNERVLYSRDVADLPPELGWFIPMRMPDAVVRPSSVKEVVGVVKAAARHGAPLVPRGAATAGMGGAVPFRGGVVVDTTGMADVLSVDREGLRVRVRPGARWQALGERLAKEGLALRCYPSSAPSSTVGGWVAQGGFGIGSFRHGHVRSSVLAVDFVTADGKEREVTGSGLDLVCGTMGAAGIITSVTLSVDRAALEVPLLFALPDAGAVASLSMKLPKGGPVWTAGFTSPGLTGLRKAAFADRPGEGEVGAPEGTWLFHVVLRGKEAGPWKRKLGGLVTGMGGYMLGEDAALEHHGRRFHTMRQAPAARGFVPAETVVPLGGLDEFFVLAGSIPGLGGRSETGPGDVPMECTLVRDGGGVSVVVLAFAPDERRRFDGFGGWSFPMEMLRAARHCGGRSYGAGPFLPFEFDEALGKETVRSLAAHRKSTDPSGLMNPGKVTDVPAGMRSVLWFGRKAVRLYGRLFPYWNAPDDPASADSGGRGTFARALTGFHDGTMARGGIDLTPAMECAHCGYCTVTCPVYVRKGAEGVSPRGRLQRLQFMMCAPYEPGLLGRMGDALRRRRLDARVVPDDGWLLEQYSCTLCGRCEEECPSGIAFTSFWEQSRRWACLAGLAPTGNHRALSASVTDPKKGNPLGAPAVERGEWLPEEGTAKGSGGKVDDGGGTVSGGKENYRGRGTVSLEGSSKGRVLFYAGCLESHQAFRLARASVTILEAAGEDFVTLGGDEPCCGTPLVATGVTDGMEELARRNVDAARAAGADTIVSGCPGCVRAWKVHIPGAAGDQGLKVIHFSELLDRYVREGRLALERKYEGSVVWHDPCELGRVPGLSEGLGVFGPPRNVLRAVCAKPVVEFAASGMKADCCGGGGGIMSNEPAAAAAMAAGRLGAALEAGADTVVSGCPTCWNNLREGRAAFREGVGGVASGSPKAPGSAGRAAVGGRTVKAPLVLDLREVVLRCMK